LLWLIDYEKKRRQVGVIIIRERKGGSGCRGSDQNKRGSRETWRSILAEGEEEASANRIQKEAVLLTLSSTKNREGEERRKQGHLLFHQGEGGGRTQHLWESFTKLETRHGRGRSQKKEEKVI